jgi:hypothetical protein
MCQSERRLNEAWGLLWRPKPYPYSKITLALSTSKYHEMNPYHLIQTLKTATLTTVRAGLDKCMIVQNSLGPTE